MKEKWKKVKLCSICESISDGDHLPPPKAESGIPFVTIANITSNTFDFSNTMFVPRAYYEKLDSKRKAKKGDILYSVVGSFGIPVLQKYNQEFVFQRHIAILRPLNNIVCSNFLFYTMLSKDFYAKADAVALGAAQRTVSLTSLRNIEITLPPLPTQQKIASILSAYDDLIENNRKQIKLLEEAAQKLYKEWFVKLNFPGHKNTKIVDGVPEGWKKEKLGDWCRVFTGKKNANQNVEKGLYPFFTCAPDPLLSNDSLYKGKAVIISGNGSYTGRTQFYDGDFDLYQRTYACVKQKDVGYEYMPFIYYSMKVLFEPIKMGGTKGAAIPYIVMNDITDTEFLYDETLCKKYSSFAESTLDKISALKKQIVLLQTARDKILPKLMNGEIEV